MVALSGNFVNTVFVDLKTGLLLCTICVILLKVEVQAPVDLPAG